MKNDVANIHEIIKVATIKNAFSFGEFLTANIAIAPIPANVIIHIMIIVIVKNCMNAPFVYY